MLLHYKLYYTFLLLWHHVLFVVKMFTIKQHADYLEASHTLISLRGLIHSIYLCAHTFCDVRAMTKSPKDIFLKIYPFHGAIHDCIQQPLLGSLMWLHKKQTGDSIYVSIPQNQLFEAAG